MSMWYNLVRAERIEEVCVCLALHFIQFEFKDFTLCCHSSTNICVFDPPTL